MTENFRSVFLRLNDEQKEAVDRNAHTVVLAGPGSGKTATIIVKVGQLLGGRVRPPRGLACVTYNRDTVRECRSRLAGFGIYPGQSVFLGTVHGFCLNRVLRPFANLLTDRTLGEREVISAKVAQRYSQQALDHIGISHDLLPDFAPVRKGASGSGQSSPNLVH